MSMTDANKNEVPLRVELYLVTPMIVPSFDKTLDAVLSWARVRKAEEDGADEPILSQHDLPLAKHVVGDQWCFMASNLHYEWSGPRFMTFRTKTQRMQTYADAWTAGTLARKPSIDTMRGATKAGLYELARRQCTSVVAWCVGSQHGVEQLLARVTHLGKLHAKGAGQVSRYVVAVDDQAFEKWRTRVLPHASPHAAGTNYADTMSPLWAPYWDASKQVLARAPF